MWKIFRTILLPIIWILLAFPNNNKAVHKLSLKTVANIKLGSPAAVQTNIPSALKQIKKPNLLRAVALSTMPGIAGIMAYNNSHNNSMESNGDNAGHIISKNGKNNAGLMERIRESYENLKNANIVSSKTNGPKENLYGKNWPLHMDKNYMANFGVGWSEHIENKRNMDKIERNELKYFDGKKLNAVEDGQNKELIEEKEKENGMELMNKIKNIGLNSAKKLEKKWINQNKIEIEIGANIGEEMAKNVKKICEIMQKILEINVNVKNDSMMNGNGKNYGIGMQLKIYNGQTGAIELREIKIPLLSDKHGKMEMNPMELGKELIRQICGGYECDQPPDLPQFGADPCSVKPPPELHELDRSLRPMLLKLGSKLNTDLLPSLKWELERFERNAPIRFIALQNDNIESSKFKNQLYFVIHHGKSRAENDGLERNIEKNVVYLNAEELLNGSHFIQETLLKALGVKAGEGLRTEYDRRDKHMPRLRRAFAQLNAAYGAENYSIRGQPYYLMENNLRIQDKPEVQFWMGPEYANFTTRKYEIPVVYDESFKELANENQKLFEEIYAGFAKNSVIQFVVHEKVPENKNYIRICRDKNDDSAGAFVGCTAKCYPSPQCSAVYFGKNEMKKNTIYHELMHAAGMHHEHQRADVEQHIGVNREKAQKFHSYDDYNYMINYMPNLIYLPLHEYNPGSIMHYSMDWRFNPKSEKAKQQINQALPDEPTQMDWENLNHFYGVGKGRTQFKVEIDENGQQKIVDDIDGMRRLKK